MRGGGRDWSHGFPAFDDKSVELEELTDDCLALCGRRGC